MESVLGRSTFHYYQLHMNSQLAIASQPLFLHLLFSLYNLGKNEDVLYAMSQFFHVSLSSLMKHITIYYLLTLNWVHIFGLFLLWILYFYLTHDVVNLLLCHFGISSYDFTLPKPVFVMKNMVKPSFIRILVFFNLFSQKGRSTSYLYFTYVVTFLALKNFK